MEKSVSYCQQWLTYRQMSDFVGHAMAKDIAESAGPNDIRAAINGEQAYLCITRTVTVRVVNVNMDSGECETKTTTSRITQEEMEKHQ